MYGVPTEVLVTTDPDMTGPIEIEDGFQLLLPGHTKLAGDATPVDLVAYHQFKSLPDGLVGKLCALFPAATPMEIVDGHQVHLSIEFSSALEMIAAAG